LTEIRHQTSELRRLDTLLTFEMNQTRFKSVNQSVSHFLMFNLCLLYDENFAPSVAI